MEEAVVDDVVVHAELRFLVKFALKKDERLLRTGCWKFRRRRWMRLPWEQEKNRLSLFSTPPIGENDVRHVGKVPRALWGLGLKKT